MSLPAALLPRRRIAVVGAGAIGSLYGALLQRAGDEVVFVVRRGAQQLANAGLRFTGKDGVWSVAPVVAVSDTAEVGPVDVVLLTLKATGNESLRRLLPPLLRPGTVVVSLQNGLGSDELVESVCPPGQPILGMLCFVAATRLSPGEVEVFHRGTVALGPHRNAHEGQVPELAARFERAGVPCKVGENLAELRWRKLVWNIPFNGLSIAAGCIDTFRIMSDPALVAEVRGLMDEVAATAAAYDCVVTEEFKQSQVDVTPRLGAYRPSSLIDFQAGRELELESIWGEPVRRARAKGVPVPRMSLLYAVLRGIASTRTTTQPPF